MQLNVQDVAQVMQVTERTVRRWIKDEGLPVRSVSGQDYVHRLAFFEWALTRRIAGATAILGEHPLETLKHEPLAKAIEAGEALRDLATTNRHSALRAVAEQIELPDEVDRRIVVDLFLSQAFVDSISFGDGIVVPHPRHPVILPVRVPRVTICHFEPSVKLVSGHAETMRTLFVIVAPTVRRHQLLLGHLTLFLWDNGFRSLIGNLASPEEIARFVRRWHHPVTPALSNVVSSQAKLATMIWPRLLR